jgi:hypothetical protein
MVNAAMRVSLRGMVIRIDHQEAVNKRKVRPAVVLVHDKTTDIGVVALGTTSHALNKTLEFFSVNGGARSPFEQDTLFFLSDICRIEGLTGRVAEKIRRLPVLQFQQLESFAEPRVLELAALTQIEEPKASGGDDAG